MFTRIDQYRHHSHETLLLGARRLSQSIDELKTFIRAFLRNNMAAVPPQRANSGKVHLEVLHSRKKRRPLGLEIDHDAQVNLWLVRMNVPQILPATVVAVHKEPMGRGWTDFDDKGANSNFISDQEFRTKRLTGLAIISFEDARIVLDALLP